MEFLDLRFMLQNCVLINKRFCSLIYHLSQKYECDVMFEQNFSKKEPRIYHLLSIREKNDRLDGPVMRMMINYLKIKFCSYYRLFLKSCDVSGLFTFWRILTQHCREGKLKIRKHDIYSIITNNPDWNFKNEYIQNVCEKIMALHRYNEEIFSRVFDIENDSFTEEGYEFVVCCFYFFDSDNDNMLSFSETSALLNMMGDGFSAKFVHNNYETIENKLTLKGFKDFFINRAKKLPHCMSSELHKIRIYFENLEK